MCVQNCKTWTVRIPVKGNIEVFEMWCHRSKMGEKKRKTAAT